MRYPSVTEVLSVYSSPYVGGYVLKQAQHRGIEVHSACLALARGLWTLPVSQEHAGYVLSFERWLELVDAVLLVETKLTDETYGYTGRPDMIVQLAGENHPRVVDLKTSATRGKLWAAQIAAYENLARKAGYPVRRSGTLRLSRTGKLPKYDEYTESPAAFNAFLAALTAYKFFKKGE